MHDLAAFSVADMAECTRVVHKAGSQAASMEECAGAVVRYLYEHLTAGPSGGSGCALVRFFKTHDCSRLEPELRSAAREAMSGQEPRDVKCLVLLATAGDEPAWNDRRRSAGHRAIPLPAPQAVARMPMVSQLVRQLGFDVSEILRPDPDMLIDLEERTTNVFFVGDAAGSPHIPAQAEFVQPYGVKSVIGFGGVLPSGNLFATILFSKVRVTRERAELFRILAVSVKAAVVRFDLGPVFTRGEPTPTP